MGQESRIELWSPLDRGSALLVSETDRLRCERAMKTAGRENPNYGVAWPRNRAHGAVGQNRSRSIEWAAKQEKFQPQGRFFFLTSTFIELTRTRLRGEGRAEEGQHVVAGEIGEGSELEGVVAAREAESARMSSVAAERGEHLLGEFGQHGGVVFAVDHQAIAAGTLTTFDIRHGADRGPVVAEFINSDSVAKTLPNVR